MENCTVNKNIFKFKHLPDFARYILENKLDEFVLMGIRFCREIDLPLLRPLAKFSEQELVELSMESNKQILLALVQNDVGTFIESNLNTWIDNKVGSMQGVENSLIDRGEVVAEDVTLVFYIRRKLFSFFLYSYTQNPVIQKLIVEETDYYTTQEELITLKVYLEIQKELHKK